MTVHLFDANVLIALTVVEHEHHARVSAWAASPLRFAVCPIVEGALVRFMVRIGVGAGAACDILRGIRSMERCEFWPDSLSYADADLSHVRGHRQVTDAYLVSLAVNHGATLATLDEALAKTRPDDVALIPPG